MTANSTVRTAKSAKAARARAPKERSVRPGDADFYRGDDYPIADSIGYLVKRLRLVQERLVDDEMAEHDLTGVQWGPLLLLHYGIGSTAADIARWACIDTGAVTRMVDRLEAKGLVKRTPCPNDRRVVQLKLTAEGERLCREIPFGLSRVSNHLLRGFTRQEFETLKDFLRRMLANADRR
jgi:DNA-binding MarR family transcriptional regulator